MYCGKITGTEDGAVWIGLDPLDRRGAVERLKERHSMLGAAGPGPSSNFLSRMAAKDKAPGRLAVVFVPHGRTGPQTTGRQRKGVGQRALRALWALRARRLARVGGSRPARGPRQLLRRRSGPKAAAQRPSSNSRGRRPSRIEMFAAASSSRSSSALLLLSTAARSAISPHAWHW